VTVENAKSSLPYRPSAGIMLLNAQKLVFVGKRTPRLDATEGQDEWWQMPQGGVDAGEDPEIAARRELFEETGIRSISFLARSPDWLTYDLPPELVGVAWKGRYRGQKQMWFLTRFEGEESEITLTPEPQHKSEFESWKWVPVEALPALVVPFKRAVYEHVISTFAPIIATLPAG
jgi:putative (di)nucleoside polyphosphate hydrolase